MLHLHAVLRRVRTATPAESSGGRTDLVPGLRRVAALAQRRSLMVVVTDLLVASGWRQALAVLAARHEVVVVELVDPREVTLPAVGILTLVDPETGRSRTVDTSSRRVRERFTEVAAAHRRHAAETVRDAGAHHLALGTDRDWVRDVVRFLAARRRQVAAGAGSRP